MTTPQEISFRQRVSDALRALPNRVDRAHRGHDPRVGLDCLGISVWAYGRAGYNLAKLVPPYGPDDEDRRALAAVADRILEHYFEQVAKPESGDLARLAIVTADGRTRNHFGICLVDATGRWVYTIRRRLVRMRLELMTPGLGAMSLTGIHRPRLDRIETLG
jgi:hypothetical protein